MPAPALAPTGTFPTLRGESGPGRPGPPAPVGPDVVRGTQPQRPVIVAHADRTSKDHALRETVLHAGRQIDDFTGYTWYVSVDADDRRSRTGLMDLADVPLPADVHVFTCGPLPFLRQVRSALLARGVPADHIRYEVVGPDLWAAPGA